jgi:alpha-beta hydrolase superfamily lysophospholipase
MTATLDSSPIRVASPAARRATEHEFSSFDGTRLFYRAWLPQGARASKAVLLFHRGHEHSGRWRGLVEALCARADFEDVAVFAHDARGHGRSPGERGYAPDLSHFVRDADAFARHVAGEYGIEIEGMAVVAHSVGAVIAAAWVHDYGPAIRAMVLATPALAVKLYVPLALPTLRVLNRVKGRSFIKSYVKPRMLTSDPAEADAYKADGLISKQIANNILIDLHDTSKQLIADAGAIDVPAMVFAAGRDWVVKNGAIRRFVGRLGSPDRELVEDAGSKHAVFHDVGRERFFELTGEFLAKHFAQPTERSIDAVYSYTRRQYERLVKARPWYCPKGLVYRANRLFLRTVGRLSRGVRLGWESGFNSGRSLDHVYANRARGATPLGWLIDRFYLNAVGWRGIRQRKRHLHESLRRAVDEQVASGRAVHIVDIASGPGRYVLEFLAELGTRGSGVSATLRDRDSVALEQGRRLASALNLSRVTFEPGDAFSAEELARLDPRPTIAVVSGLYELFEDNAMIASSLRGLAAALEPGDWLIYTNQPWHPQLEFIARVLDGPDGRPWVMRCRTQREMDYLVERAGFEKREMLIDRWGIFTVSLAVRRR